MSRKPRRTTVGAATLVALTSIALVLTGVTPAPAAGAPARSAQDAPEVRVMPTPAPSGATQTRAHPGTSGGPSAAATVSPETAAVPAEAGVPQSIIGSPETVIGPDGRRRLVHTATSAYPLRAIGQIEFFQGGVMYICTGYLIDANSILTAGHCAFNGGQGDPIESATFFPGRNRIQGVVSNPYGSCGVNGLWANDKWRFEGIPAHDYAVMHLDCDIGASIGWFGLFHLAGTNAFAGRRFRVEGYPGDKGYGSRWMMAGLVQRSSINTLHYPMDTFGGQSGSPVFKWNRPSCGGPCSAGVHAYGAAGNPLTNSGPRLTAGRISLIAAVAAQNGG